MAVINLLVFYQPQLCLKFQRCLFLFDLFVVNDLKLVLAIENLDHYLKSEKNLVNCTLWGESNLSLLNIKLFSQFSLQ